MDFRSELLLIPEVFENHFFKVPDYQRSFSWGDKQIKDFLADLDHLCVDDSPLRHFTGTLVLSRPDAESDYFHVVDGQQRLTTLSIFLNEILDHIEGEEKNRLRETYILRGEYGNERQVLTLNKDSNGFFLRNVLGGGKNVKRMESHERLHKAKGLINKWVVNKIDKGYSAEDLAKTAEKKLGFLVYAPRETAETGIMFEVINNRGKSLSELEKVKNYLIYCASKLGANRVRQDIDSDWSNILRNLNTARKTSQGEEGAFLRYCLIVFLQLNKHDSQNGYEELKKRIDISEAIANRGESNRQSIELIRSFLKFLSQASLWYARLYGKNSQDRAGLPRDLVAVLDRIRAQVRHAAIMPVYLALVIKGSADNSSLVKLIELLEIVNFRVYMARGITNRNDSGQAEIYSYAGLYYHDRLQDQMKSDDPDSYDRLIKTEEDVLEYYLVWFALYFAMDETFLDSFRLKEHENYDFFDWGGIRYFLMNYEEYLQPNKTIKMDRILLSRKEGKTKDYYSVEHIWSRENRAEDGKNNRREDQHERRRLGNFALLELRLNIQGKNKDIEEKLPIYIQGQNSEAPSDLQQIRKIETDLDIVNEEMEKNWQRRTHGYYREQYQLLNDLRERRYIDFARVRWSLASFLGYEELVEYYTETEEV